VQNLATDPIHVNEKLLESIGSNALFIALALCTISAMCLSNFDWQSFVTPLDRVHHQLKQTSDYLYNNLGLLLVQSLLWWALDTVQTKHGDSQPPNTTPVPALSPNICIKGYTLLLCSILNSKSVANLTRNVTDRVESAVLRQVSRLWHISTTLSFHITTWNAREDVGSLLAVM